MPELDNSPVKIGVCLTSADLFGRPYGLRECQAILRRLNFQWVAFRIALARQANDLLFEGENVQGDEGIRDCGLVFPAVLGKSYAAEALRQAANLAPHSFFHAFSDQALAAALELAGTVCPRIGGGNLTTDVELDDLGRVVFSFQGASFSPKFMRFVASKPDWSKTDEPLLAEVVRNNLANNRLGAAANAVARLYGFSRLPSIHAAFQERTGEAFDEWFHRRLDMTPAQYLRASFLIAAATARFQRGLRRIEHLVLVPSRLLDALPQSDRSNVAGLLELATMPEADLRGDPATNLTHALYGAQSLRKRPLLDFGEFLLPTSANGVIEKFMVGIPHLLDEAARAREPVPDIPLVRLKFGHVIESYVGHLIQSWLGRRPDTVVFVGLRLTGAAETDFDVIVVRGETAYLFEVKAKVFHLNMRREGSFGVLDSMLLEPFKKTRLQAERLLAFAQQADAPAALRTVRRVVPSLVVFDRVPIRFPYLDQYEHHVEARLGKKIFTAPGDVIAPVQTFEIEGLEAWEQFIDLQPESEDWFTYMEERARDPLKRHDRRFPPGHTEGVWRNTGGPVQDLLRDSQAMFQSLAREVSFDEEPA